MFGKLHVRNHTAFWDYAQLNWTNNYALHKLTTEPCPSTEVTHMTYLDAAKTLVKMVTFIVDISCLDKSMALLAEQLGWDRPQMNPHKNHASAAERLDKSTMHDWFLRKNQRYIKLYQCARDRVILNYSETS